MGYPAWYAWAGYAFESICLKHSGQIKKALGIAGVTTVESHWQYVPPKSSKDTGAEIDLIIDRADNCIHLCEMKFCDSEFIIDKAYAKKLEQKKEIFQKITGTHKTLFLTLITPYGVKRKRTLHWSYRSTANHRLSFFHTHSSLKLPKFLSTISRD